MNSTVLESKKGGIEPPITPQRRIRSVSESSPVDNLED